MHPEDRAHTNRRPDRRRPALAHGLRHQRVKPLLAPARGGDRAARTGLVNMDQRIRVHAPFRRFGCQPRNGLCLLRIQRLFHQAARQTMHRKARRTARHTHAGLQNRPLVGIVQRHAGIISGPRSRAQRRDIGADRLGHAEQFHRLIQQMRPQIIPDARPRAAILAPAVTQLRAKTVKARFKLHHRPDQARIQRRAHRQKIAVPPPVVKRGQHQAPFRRQTHQIARLAHIQRKGLFHHHMLARQQGLTRQRCVGAAGRCDHHQRDGRIGQHIGHLARHHRAQFQRCRGADIRRVKHTRGHAIADNGGADTVHRVQPQASKAAGNTSVLSESAGRSSVNTRPPSA